MAQSLTYVYCLVRSPRPPVFSGVSPSMPGGDDVRVLPAGGGLWLVASTVPAREYDEAALARGLQNLDWVGRRAMAHEAVVEQFLDAPALLPMQLFTLFISDQRALEHVSVDGARLERILSRIERQLEWGLRLTFDERGAREAVERAHQTSRAPRISARSAPSGAAYLARKRDLLDVSRVQLLEARTEADRLYRAMAREATESRRRTATEQAAPGSRLLVDAAFLVPARRAGSFRTALRRQARKLEAAGVVVSLTGPWPPYNFIDGVDGDAGADAPKPRKPARGRASTAPEAKAASSPARRSAPQKPRRKR